MARRFAGIQTDTAKLCTKCKRMVPLTGYNKHNGMRDGLNTRCRKCQQEYDRNHYRDHIGEQVLALRDELKMKYVNMMGGKCIRCGYNEFIAGLDFHHTENKEHSVASLFTKAAYSKLSAAKIALLERELSKCVLLCSNCHKGLHANRWTLTPSESIRFIRLEPEVEYRTDELAYLPLFNGIMFEN